MLRPATPLSILLFIAFVLLLLATISTPIIKAIPLATVNGVSLGVFGYCESGPKGCTGIKLGYSVDAQTLFGDEGATSDFSLPPGARSSLSSILIVHPVAALLTLILFIMSLAAHFHSPSHSPKFLIAILITSIPTLLITLLAFLVDLLLFVPHLAWGGWIVLGSTILILASGIVTCAMRRTLVSRKERKRRIAENDEMNGANFYSNQNPVPQGVRADSPPPLSATAVPPSEKLASFTTYGRKSAEEDRIPLNTRQPSQQNQRGLPPNRTPSKQGSYNAPMRGGQGNMRGGRGGFPPPRDEFGKPLPSSNAFGPAPPMGIRRDRSEPPMRRQYSDESMNAYASRGGRGRGGYPPRGYGRGRPYGQPPGRGGYGRGGIGLPPQRGAPPGYANDYPPPTRPGQYDRQAPAGYARSPSAPGYGRRNYSPAPPMEDGPYGRHSPGPAFTAMRSERGQPYGPPSDPGGYARAPSRGQVSDPGGYNQDRQEAYGPPSRAPYREPSPLAAPPSRQPEDYGAIGQAVEMDARHGSPSAQPLRFNDSDSTVRGMVHLQQNQGNRDTPQSLSDYSGNEPYLPPRAQWKDQNSSSELQAPGNFLNMDSATSSSAIDPVELPDQNTLRKPRTNTGPSRLNPASHARKPSDNYYEDVDPRFASPSPPHGQISEQQSSGPMPAALMPGPKNMPVEQHAQIVDPGSSYDDLQDGQQSPASDHSNMTSISQRGVNPNWQPGDPPQQGGRLGVPGGRKPVMQPTLGATGLAPEPSNGRLPAQGSMRAPPPGNSFAQAVVPPVTMHGQAF